MANFKLSKQTKEDLIRIYQYGFAKFGESEADKYVNQLFAMFQRISERPYAFESLDFIKLGYRRCVCGVDSIFYRINDGKVEIMTIVGRQDIDQIFR